MCEENPDQGEPSSIVDLQTNSFSKSGPSPRPPSRTRSSLKSDPANEYKQLLSEKLFDILSHQKVKSTFFDEDFYNDQKGPRTLWISKKVSSEYKQQTQQQQKTAQTRERRRQLATGESSIPSNSISMGEEFEEESEIDLEEDDLEEADLDDFMDTSSARDTPEVSDRPCTRSTSALSFHTQILSTLSTSTQTESLSLGEATFPNISTRKVAVVKGKASHLMTACPQSQHLGYQNG